MDDNIRVKVVLKNYGINITEMCRNLSWSREAFSRVANGHRALSVEKAKTVKTLQPNFFDALIISFNTLTPLL